ncbi:hypothetical protein [Paracoccus sp. (in: a-proteobacteria)]|uniref:hypothetical protein n=1 Tax=Paracoccus sp. TaxID=267 RepID=UPI0026DFFF26|nr:hypothetical protein [Paracoccus sp. (in: a-proteobacteria)]MDO5647695.1 hypothetical protein [Paracoccus sp. (in: a-proteobacteria)]
MKLLRRIVATLGGLWSALMLVLMAMSLALSVAMTVIPAVFMAVAGVVETVTGVKTVRSRHAAQLTAANTRADNLARELADSRVAGRRMAQELADSRVTYRGTRVAARQAVADTTTRVSKRVSTAAARNIASTAGEALPVVGIGVIAAATAWEIHDACQLMGDMRELDAAFNPDNPTRDAEVCGMTVPTRADLWRSIKSSPGAAWDGARGMYDGLPELSFGRAWGAFSAAFGRAYDRAFGTAEDTE